MIIYKRARKKSKPKIARILNVYRIVNRMTDKCYIGISDKPLEKILALHVSRAKRGDNSGKNWKLYAAMRHFDYEDFIIQLIYSKHSSSITPSDVNAVIIKEQTIKNGYNYIHLGSRDIDSILTRK